MRPADAEGLQKTSIVKEIAAKHRLSRVEDRNLAYQEKFLIMMSWPVVFPNHRNVRE